MIKNTSLFYVYICLERWITDMYRYEIVKENDELNWIFITGIHNFKKIP